MTRRYDATVVGARCAGSPTAMLLARKGYRVLLVDSAAFPSDAISTQYIHQSGAGRLESWGLLERVRATNCPPVRKGMIDFGGLTLKGSPPPPEAARLVVALQGNQADTDRFFSIDAGTVAPPGFFASENVGRIMGAAGMISG